jgi:hypothetical protein
VAGSCRSSPLTGLARSHENRPGLRRGCPEHDSGPSTHDRADGSAREATGSSITGSGCRRTPTTPGSGGSGTRERAGVGGTQPLRRPTVPEPQTIYSCSDTTAPEPVTWLMINRCGRSRGVGVRGLALRERESCCYSRCIDRGESSLPRRTALSARYPAWPAPAGDGSVSRIGN